MQKITINGNIFYVPDSCKKLSIPRENMREIRQPVIVDVYDITKEIPKIIDFYVHVVDVNDMEIIAG